MITYRSFEIQGSTVRYLESLCDKYGLTEEDIISQGLKLVELNLAEFEARRAAIQKCGYEA